MRLAAIVLFGFSLGLTASIASAQAAQKIAGEIVRFNAGVLEMKTTAGARETIRVTDRTRISVRGRSDITRIEPGSFVGATAAPRGDGTLVASEVHIFPESQRGTGEGHRPMTGSDTMTNATVSSVSGRPASRSTETNATVANVGGNDGEVALSMTYKGGEKMIVVPRGTPVMTTGTGDPSMLVAGSHVIVYASTQSDGGLVAERISVGKDGYVPPI